MRCGPLVSWVLLSPGSSWFLGPPGVQAPSDVDVPSSIRRSAENGDVSSFYTLQSPHGATLWVPKCVSPRGKPQTAAGQVAARQAAAS